VCSPNLADEHSDFRYLTPKRRLEVDSLSDEQALASAFHMVCSPSRCMSLVEALRARRSALTTTIKQPIVIWEPIPDLCTPAELQNLQEASTFVNVISPNGEELADFFASGNISIAEGDMVRSLLTKCGEHPEQAVVVRNGADGSRAHLRECVLHFKAFHQEPERVIDPTGGGNTYLGAMAMALTERVTPGLEATAQFLNLSITPESRSLLAMILAAAHGTIAASYAIEQIGTPSLTVGSGGTWNGEAYEDRYMLYLRREKSYLLQQLAIHTQNLIST
jgi:sugar/nucleoside kinase (ribokinase family)